MRILSFFSVLTMYSCFVISQNKNDSIQFQNYYEKAYRLRNVNPDSSFVWIEKALAIAQSASNEEWLAKSFNLKGILYYKKSEYFKSLTELEKALKHASSNELKGKIYINLGNTLSDMGYTYSAMDYYKAAIQIFNTTNNFAFLIRALMNLASEELNIGWVTNARNHLKLALYYAHENNLMEEEAMCLNNLSALYIQSGLVDSASRYIYQSFNAYEQTENYYGLADAYLTAIELHLEKKEWSYAKALIDLADSVVNHLNYLEGKVLLTGKKVSYYLSTNDCAHAQQSFNEYLLLEDSLNKMKKPVPEIVFSDRQKLELDKQSDMHLDYVAYLQLALMVGIGTSIGVAVLKNYRYDKEK